MGVREQIIFPEIEYDKIDALRGLNITITTTAKPMRKRKLYCHCLNFRSRIIMAKKALINRDLKRQALAKNMRLNARQLKR